MGHGAIIRTVSTAGRCLAAPADTVPRIMVRIPIPQAHGASTAVPSIVARKPAPGAACPLTTTPITPIPMAGGQVPAIPSTSAQKPVQFVRQRQMNTRTTPTRMRMVSVMIVARMSR